MALMSYYAHGLPTLVATDLLKRNDRLEVRLAIN
jgi:hypothetical protein